MSERQSMHLSEDTIRLQERNKQRPFLKKLFRQDKTTLEQIVAESSNKWGEGIHREITEGLAENTEQALINLESNPEFMPKTRETIRKEEKALALIKPVVLQKVIENKFEEALFTLKQEQRKKEDRDTEISFSMHNQTVESVKDQLFTLDITKDTPAIAEALHTFAGAFNIQDVPQEFLNNELLQTLLGAKLTQDLLTRSFDLENQIQHISYFEKIGLLEKGFLQSDKVREAAEQRAFDIFKSCHSRSDLYVPVWKKLEKLGLISMQEIIKLTAVYNFAIQKSIEIFKTCHSRPDLYKPVWETFHKLGIVSTHEVVSLKEIHDFALQKSVEVFLSCHSRPDLYRPVWETYISLGIFSRNEIITHPAVRKDAFERSVSLFTTCYNRPDLFLKDWNTYHDLGIISYGEIIRIPEIRAFAREKATSLFETTYNRSDLFLPLWNKFEEAGIFSHGEIRTFPEISAIAATKLEELRRNYLPAYEELKKKYDELGIGQETEFTKKLREKKNRE